MSMVFAVARSHVDVRGLQCIRGPYPVTALLQQGILIVVCAEDARNYVDARNLCFPAIRKEQMSHFCGDINGYGHTLRKKDVEEFSDNPISIPISPPHPDPQPQNLTQ